VRQERASKADARSYRANLVRAIGATSARAIPSLQGARKARLASSADVTGVRSPQAIRELGGRGTSKVADSQSCCRRDGLSGRWRRTGAKCRSWPSNRRRRECVVAGHRKVGPGAVCAVAGVNSFVGCRTIVVGGR
jgi:hypothetical protein